MEMIRQAVLGIDTSNYTTSVALVSQNRIIRDERRFLKVQKGERGLRQSEALFQHIKSLPLLMETLMDGFQGTIAAVAAASRPRPVEGSYMPVFIPGQSVGKSIAASLSVPYYEFSHQEGHIYAVMPESWSDFHCLHMSGGTTELLKVKEGTIVIIGGTKDISLGQLLDRVGVKMGLNFPAGGEMDRLAGTWGPSSILKPIPIKNGWMNLSGMESQCLRALEEGVEPGPLASEMFQRIADGIVRLVGDEKTLLVGGVSSSHTLRRALGRKNNIHIPPGNLGGDNAVGIARLGGSKIWP